MKAGPANTLAIDNVKSNEDVGMLIIDFANRRRIRLNGEAKVLAEGALLVHAKQVYSNCPRYIQQRVWDAEGRALQDSAAGAAASSHLSSKQCELVRRADTFFVASAHREFGVDVSHRGGNPGFIRVENPTRLLWPDYNGNKMFNTLGNVATNPSVGLLFPDFVGGSTLQLTGRAAIEWDSAQSAFFPGAERILAFEIEAVAEATASSLPHYRFQSYSPHNPAST